VILQYFDYITSQYIHFIQAIHVSKRLLFWQHTYKQ